MTAPASPPDADALRAAWERVVAARDASPPDCQCRSATGPLIDAWFGRVTVRQASNLLVERDGFRAPQDPQAEARCRADLAAAQAAQTAAARLPPAGGDWLLDVREEAEVRDRPRPGAVNIPLGQLRRRLAEVPRDRRVVVFCASGKRAPLGVDVLRAAGYSACDGHAATCPAPWALGPDGTPVQADEAPEVPHLVATGPVDARLGAADEPGGVLAGLLSSAQGAAAGAGQGLGAGAGQGAADAFRAAVPGLADAVRAEVPRTVAAAADAAKTEAPAVVQAVDPAVREAAEGAGAAAARGARGEVSGSAWGAGATLAAGAVLVLGVGAAVWAAFFRGPPGK